jgi:hypothetical protein
LLAESGEEPDGYVRFVNIGMLLAGDPTPGERRGDPTPAAYQRFASLSADD